MIVQIDKSVYEMSCDTFDRIVELILEENSSRYFIYCLVRKGVYILTNDFFEDEKQFKNYSAVTLKKGLIYIS